MSGIECHRCGCRDLRVEATRKVPGGKIQRRRRCRHCGAKIYTYEKTVGADAKKTGDQR